MTGAAGRAARPWKIMLVEDNAAEARLTALVLQETGLTHALVVARDGEEALAMLRRQGQHAALAEPDLVLLDLNLPRKDGREVLAEIKTDKDLRHIPVLILSTSRAEHDVLTCYRLHANCYLQKPLELEAFSDLLRAIGSFWLSGSVLLPSKPLGEQREH